jgi:hypothetical protein
VNKSISGKVSALWPGSTIAEVRYDDWNIAHSGNRFAFLGNGFSQARTTLNQDNGPYLSRSEQMKIANNSGAVDRHKESQGRSFTL